MARRPSADSEPFVTDNHPEPARAMGDTGTDATSEPGSDIASHSSATPNRVERTTGRQRPVSFSQMLIEAGILSTQQVERVSESAHRERVPLGQVLVRDGLVLSRDLAILTALHLGLPMVELRAETIEQEAVALLPIDTARKYLVLPLRRNGHELTVAMIDPMDLRTLQDLTSRTGCAILPVIATPEDIEEHIELAYRIAERQVAQSLADGDEAVGRRVTAEVLKGFQPTEVLNLLLERALQDRASDVHIEPSESRLRVRFRIDGILHEVMNLPPAMHPGIISRVKIMSGMNIAERRRPQDGQMRVEASDRTVDARVAFSNTAAGEMAVLRLLDNKKLTLLSLSQLGMSGHVLEETLRLLRLPHGMVVVCGPTGSGKSTSLYASILQMDRSELKVVSIEDPVEYRISDISQMQVHTEVGVTFATQLRSVLRLDPDVIVRGGLVCLNSAARFDKWNRAAVR